MDQKRLGRLTKLAIELPQIASPRQHDGREKCRPRDSDLLVRLGHPGSRRRCRAAPKAPRVRQPGCFGWQQVNGDGAS